MNTLVTEDDVPQCIECKKTIDKKPWITVKVDNNECVYACRYLCTKYLSSYVGRGYSDRIVNKEDFDFPILTYPHQSKKDITCNFEGKEIIQEIHDEEERVRKIEEEYMESTDDELYEEN